MSTHTHAKKHIQTHRLSAGAIALSGNTLSGHYIQHEIFMADAGMWLRRKIAVVFVCLYSWTLLYFCICTRGCCTRCVHTVCVFVCVYERLGLHSAPDVLLIHRWQRRWNISCQPREAGLQKLQFSLLVLQRPSLYFNSPHLHTEGGEDAHCVSMCAGVNAARVWRVPKSFITGLSFLYAWLLFKAKEKQTVQIEQHVSHKHAVGGVEG